MKNFTSVLVITTNEVEQIKINYAFRKQDIEVKPLSTLFDFVVEDFLTKHWHDLTFRPSHILVDLDMGYQPAFSIIALLKQHPLTSHLPLTVFSEYESECILQRAEQSGVDAYLVRSSSWQLMAQDWLCTQQTTAHQAPASQALAA